MKQNLLKLIAICLLCLLQVGLMAQKIGTDTSAALSHETISISPNPVQDRATLSFETKLEGFTQINAYSIDGKMVVSTGKYLYTGNNSFSLSLPKGVFILKVNGIGFSKSVKVISQSINEIKPEIVYVGTEDMYAVAPNNTGIMRVNESSAPTISSFTINPIGHVFAVGCVNISSAGATGATITSRGLCWSRASVSTHPTLANSSCTSGTGIGTFCASASGLSTSTTYYISAYAVNSLGYTAISEPICVKTLNGESSGMPSLSTIDVTSISSKYAMTGGIITSQGVAPITARGMCWSTSPNPTIDDNKNTCGTGIGTFQASINNLLPATTYYVRAYATNGPGTNYGNEICFKTRAVQVGDSFNGGIVAYIYKSTDAGYVSNLRGGILISPTDLPSSAWYNGTYTLIGSSQTGLSQYGYTNTFSIVNTQGSGTYAAYLCFNYSGASGWYLPTKDELNKIYSNKSMIANLSSGKYWSSSESTSYFTWSQDFSTGTQSLDMKNNVYSVRAAKWFYAAASIPVVSTTPITLTSTAATAGGNVISDEGSAILERGICWNTTGNPTINDSKVTTGTGIGSFSNSLSALVLGQTYYVRAYATNMIGTGYGNQISFTYLYPVVVTTPVECPGGLSPGLLTGGNVISDAGQAIIDRGVCWSTSNETSTETWNKVSSNSIGTGLYEITLSGAKQTIYVCAYVTTILGTTYGDIEYNSQCIITGE